jgi:hypothetical protein
MGNFLDCIYKALKAGGRFIVRTPFEENIMNWSFYREDAPKELGHVRNFNKPLLKMILEDAGFKVQKICYDGARFGNIYRWIRKYKILKILYISMRFFLRKARLNKGIPTTDRRSDGVLLQTIYKSCNRPKEIIMVAVK